MVVNHHEGARTIQFTANIHSSNYPNAFLNNHVLSPVLKALNDVHSFREFGRLFQSVGPETEKLRGPERTDERLGMS